MLEGFVPYPEHFIRLYREKGYWIDKTIGEELDGAVARHADRVALAFEGHERCTDVRDLPRRAV